jgi:hypothetical protein
MIPVIQTKVVVKNSKQEVVVRGNCYAAAIASILELPISEVPNVETLFHIDGAYWAEVMHTFLNSNGWELLTDNRYRCFHPDLYSTMESPVEVDFDDWIDQLKDELRDKFYLVSGNSTRGIMHITIWQNGKMVHDPHPTRDGIIDLIYFETLEKSEKSETV